MTGFDARGDRYGLYVQFDKEVDETNINWTIEPLTLLTKIGGIIGVGKEFFWVIISMSGLLFMMQKYTRSLI